MTFSLRYLLGLFLLFLFAATAVPAQAQTTIYVDHANDSGTEDGTSWSTAYTDLQTAIDDAAGGDEIWIAAGVYKPSTSDPTVSFTIPGSKDGLTIYGGFESGDAFSDRDPGANPTVLSGDVDGDDETSATGIVRSNADISGDNSDGVLRLLDGAGGTLSSSTVLDGVTITGGDATNAPGQTKGGGLYCDGASGGTCSPTLRNVAFVGNQAFEGGALYNISEGGEASPTIVNTVFVGNAADAGGAVYNTALEDDNGNDGTTSPTIVNATFTDNRAIDFGQGNKHGGAMVNSSGVASVAPTIRNTILWGNTAAGVFGEGDQIYNTGGEATPTIGHTIIEGGIDGISENRSSTTDDGSNLDKDPQFEYALLPAGNDAIVGSDDDGLHVIPGSPAIDAGDGSAVPSGVSADLTGASRVQNGTVDIGAYEGGRDAGRTVYVDAATTAGTPDGTSWSRALPHLQDALAVANGTHEIWIAEGVYTPVPNFGDDSSPDDPSKISFTITGAQDGLEIYGGFAGTETSRSDRDPGANPTVLSGDLAGNDDDKNDDGVVMYAGIWYASGDPDDNSLIGDDVQADNDLIGANSNTVLYLDGYTDGPITESTVIDGVTVTAGESDAFVGDGGVNGGGLYCDAERESTFLIPERLTDVNTECSPTLRNVVFAGNQSENRGGAIYISGDGNDNRQGTASPVLLNVVFTGNMAEFGAAIYNRADGSNGIANPTITNSTITRNLAVSGTSTGTGGAIYNDASRSGDQAELTIENTILWDNVAEAATDQIGNEGGGALITMSHSLIADGTEGVVSGTDASIDYLNDSGSSVDFGGSSNLGPGFTETQLFEYAPAPAGDDGTFATADDGLHLLDGAPGIGDGDNSAVPSGVTTDATGAQRTQGGTVDIGAYEGGRDQARTIYVDADRSDEAVQSVDPVDGTSWASADSVFQDGTESSSGALDYATGNDEIWIAEGIYVPDKSRYPDSSYVITGAQDGLEIYGGFDGTESSRSQRAPRQHRTILSGDIDRGFDSFGTYQGDDPFAPNTDSDDDNTAQDGDRVTQSQTDHITGQNSDTVLRLDGTSGGNITESTVIDGVSVTGGQALSLTFLTDGTTILAGDETGSEVNGGGLYCDATGSGNVCSPTLRGMVFYGNQARDGGGAMYLAADGGTSSPTLTNVVFYGNASGGNASREGGGAMYVEASNGGTSSPVITNAVFADNSSETIDQQQIDGLVDSDVSVYENYEDSLGGPGGAVSVVASGGGTSRPTLTNTTFVDNLSGHGPAGAKGGALYSTHTGSGSTADLEVENSIFWDNRFFQFTDGFVGAVSGEIYNSGATLTLSSTLLRGGLSEIDETSDASTVDDGNNQDADPQFLAADDPPGQDGLLATTDDGLIAQAGSPAIDAGSDAALPMGVSTDLAGTARSQDGDRDGTAAPDIGAYETAPPFDVYVTGGGPSGLSRSFSATPGMAGQAVGVLKLEAQATGTLTGLTIAPGGSSAEGVDRLALRVSTDATLEESDPELAAADLDPSTAPPSTVSFDDFRRDLPAAAQYLFVTATLTSEAGGTLEPTVPSESDLKLPSGSVAKVNAADMTEFSQLQLESSGTALPVELATFDGAATTEDGRAAVRLTWTTTSETNSAGFRIQRRMGTANGGANPNSGEASRRDASTEDWETVGSVDGAGTTAETQSYRFTDTGLPYAADSLTYRLQQVDTDGSASYSEMVTVERSVSSVRLLGTAPNPARERATVRYALPEKQKTTIRLYDVLGRQVRTVVNTAAEGRYEQALDVSGLSSGVYFLRLRSAGTIKTQKLTVVR